MIFKTITLYFVALCATSSCVAAPNAAASAASATSSPAEQRLAANEKARNAARYAASAAASTVVPRDAVEGEAQAHGVNLLALQVFDTRAKFVAIGKALLDHAVQVALDNRFRRDTTPQEIIRIALTSPCNIGVPAPVLDQTRNEFSHALEGETKALNALNKALPRPLMLPELNRIIAQYATYTMPQALLQTALAVPLISNASTCRPHTLMDVYIREAETVFTQLHDAHPQEFVAFRALKRQKGLPWPHTYPQRKIWETAGFIVSPTKLFGSDRMVCKTCMVEISEFPFIDCSPQYVTKNPSARTFLHPADYHAYDKHVIKGTDNPDEIARKLYPESVQAKPYGVDKPAYFRSDTNTFRDGSDVLSTASDEYKAYVLRHLFVCAYDSQPATPRMAKPRAAHHTNAEVHLWHRFFSTLYQIYNWQHFAAYILAGPQEYNKWYIAQLDPAYLENVRMRALAAQPTQKP